jgi:hypothetical protein
MSEAAPPRPRRSRPLDVALVEPLAARAQAIAKGWLLLLLERSPLEAAGAIPAAALAAEGPGLCAALVRALGSDVELDRLRQHGDLAPLAARAGALAGSIDPAATVAAVDALRACLWTAALELSAGHHAEAAAVTALAERLAEVCATVAATALDAVALAPGRARETLASIPQPAGPGPASPYPPPLTGAPERFEPHGGRFSSPPPASGFGLGPALAPSPSEEPEYTLDDRRGQRDPDGEHDDDPPPRRSGSVTQLSPRPGADPRTGPAAAMDDSDLWISTLERHIDRCEREGGGLALLRIELVDGEHLVASASAEERGVPYGRLAQAIRRAIRRQDLVAADHEGRAWVIAPGVGRAGAMALAERIALGVEHSEPWQGAPLAAAVGFAVYGEDGRDAGALIDRAEEAMLAAAAAGVRIGESVPFDGDDADRPGPRLVR